MLSANPMGSLGAQIGLQKLQHGAENGETRQAKLTAVILKSLNEILFKQSIEDNPGRFLDFREHPFELLLGSYKRIDMLDWEDLRVLRSCGPRHRGQCLTRSIGNEV
jgi:hypothetical protein